MDVCHYALNCCHVSMQSVHVACALSIRSRCGLIIVEGRGISYNVHVAQICEA